MSTYQLIQLLLTHIMIDDATEHINPEFATALSDAKSALKELRKFY